MTRLEKRDTSPLCLFPHPIRILTPHPQLPALATNRRITRAFCLPLATAFTRLCDTTTVPKTCTGATSGNRNFGIRRVSLVCLLRWDSDSVGFFWRRLRLLASGCGSRGHCEVVVDVTVVLCIQLRGIG